MHAAKVVVGNIQGDGRCMIFQLFGERIGEPGKSAGGHAQRQVRPLGIAGRDIQRHADDGLPVYCYYLCRRIAAGSFV